MAKDYSPLAATAQRLVEQFGRSSTLVRVAADDDVPGMPWRGTSSDPITVACSAVEIDGLGYFKDDDRVKATDLTLILSGGDFSASGIEPDAGDKLDSKEVVSVKKFKPASTALAFIVAVRA